MLGAHGGSCFLVGYSGSRRMIGVHLAKQVDEVIPDAWRREPEGRELGLDPGCGWDSGEKCSWREPSGINLIKEARQSQQVASWGPRSSQQEKN